jgi:hypothetical protein
MSDDRKLVRTIGRRSLRFNFGGKLVNQALTQL